MSPTTYPELLRLARKRPIYLWGAGPTGERARLRRIIHDALFVERNPLVAAALVLGYRYFLKRAIWVRERIEAGEQTSDLPNPFLYRLR